MKIAFVAPFFGADASGGAEFAARSLATQLASAGLQIEVLTTCLKDLPSGLDRNIHPQGLSNDGNIAIRRFPVESANMEHFALLNHAILANIPLTHAEELYFMTRHVTSPTLLDWIDAQHGDYDWFCFIPYLFGTTCFGVPIAANKSITLPCFHDEGYARMQLVKRMVDHTNRFVFNCAAEQRLAQNMFNIESPRCHTIGLGLQTDVQGNADRFRQKTGLREPFVLYVGRRDTTKNVHTLIQYFQTHKAQYPSKLKLALIGPAPLPMTAPDPDVIDLGFVTEQDKYDAYEAAEVFCQPSLNESFSYVMMEA
jgi:glycosyltransferase involved in cell wall biosynthesis